MKIGLFAVAMLVCLYFGVNYLKGRDLFSSDRTFYALFESTQGLQTSAPVVVRGVKVGSVTGIEIDPEAGDRVRVTVNVKRNVSLPVDSRLRLFSDGIMGGKSIELVRGESSSVFESGAVVPSEVQGGLLDNASMSIDELVSKATALMTSLENTSNTLNVVLAKSAESFEGIMANVESVTGQVSRADVGAMIADVRSFTSVLAGNSGRLDSIVGNLDAVSGQLAAADLRGTIDGLSTTIERLDAILADIENGEGSAGKLVQDPALYDSLSEASTNLAALLKDLKENPKRYVHFSVF